MKTDMTAAEHLQQCAACNHGRTPCQEYVKAWPVQPNSVCKHCRKTIKLDAPSGFWLSNKGVICEVPPHAHEPVAEPAEPSASRKQGHSALRCKDGKLETFYPNPEGTPKVEDIARLINDRQHDMGRSLYLGELILILRPFFTPAYSPTIIGLARDFLIATGQFTPFDPNATYAITGQQIVHIINQFVAQLRIADRVLATPASTGEANPKSFLGLPVYVDNPQFTGYGIAKYDSGDRKRVIGVLLENGNTWEYDATTVREARHEELPKMPRAIREQFTAPTSVPQAEPPK